jgi:hypothetical protein
MSALLEMLLELLLGLPSQRRGERPRVAAWIVWIAVATLLAIALIVVVATRR